MLQNIDGLTVTTENSAAIAAIDRFTAQALGYGKEADNILLQGIAAAPECALLHAYRAAYLLSQESAIARKQAQPHLQLAQHQIAEVTQRERLYIQAIAAWATGDLIRAIALHEAIIQDFPRDLLSVQQGQYHCFYLGDSQRLLNIAQTVLCANSDNHYLLGMVAFGLEQCHQLAASEMMGRQAIAMNRCDPWAHHAVAHVMEMQGRVVEGINWLERYAETWETCNSLLYTHNWWHLALFYLTHEDFRKVLHLYDTQIWGRATKASPKDQVGAIATLIRLELHGVDVGDRWQTLSQSLLPRIHEHALPFQDLHYVYAFARSDQMLFVTEMLLSMQSHAQTVHPSLQFAWNEIAVPAARGMVGHAIGNWNWAIAQLKATLPHLQKIGGSHAQRALFEQIYQDAVQKQQSQSSLHVCSTVAAKQSASRLTSQAAINAGTNQRQRYTQILSQNGHLSC